jgi:hypothetical protein
MMQVMMRWWLGFLDPAAAAAAAACNKVVVVVDGEKKPSTTALDWVLTQVVKQDQGDQITILAFLQQVTSPSKNQNPPSMDHLSLSLPLRNLLLLIKKSRCPRKSTVKSLFLCLARNSGKTKKKSHLLKPPPPPPQLKREISYSILIFFFSRIFSSDHLHKTFFLPGFVFFSLLDFLGKYEEMDLGID